jgi:hypothetical protein
MLLSAVCCLALALGGCSVPDHSSDRARAAQLEATLKSTLEQSDLERAAYAACGPNSAIRILMPTTAQCTDKHGGSKRVVEVRP